MGPEARAGVAPPGAAAASGATKTKPAASLDHLVGAGEDERRQLDAERPGGAQVDDQVEVVGPLHGDGARRLAAQDARDERRRPPAQLLVAGPVAQQAAGLGHLPPLAEERQARRERARPGPPRSPR